MQNRTQSLTALRPKIPVIMEAKATSAAEKFQNTTLRPILKFQNNLLLPVFQHYIKRRKNVFYKLTEQEKLAYIQHSVTKDRPFNNLLHGMVVGHFSEEEWTVFTENEKELMRRINNLLVQRLQSQLNEL